MAGILIASLPVVVATIALPEIDRRRREYDNSDARTLERKRSNDLATAEMSAREEANRKRLEAELFAPRDKRPSNRPRVVRIDASRWTKPEIVVRCVDGSYSERTHVQTQIQVSEDIEQLAACTARELRDECRRLQRVGRYNEGGNQVANQRWVIAKTLEQVRQTYGDDASIEILGLVHRGQETAAPQRREKDAASAATPLRRSPPRLVHSKERPIDPIDVSAETVRERKP